jgi:hypothetical protein
MRPDQLTLQIENPLAVCGHCRFTSELKGEWSVEEGRLVFRADPDPQPGRGPDLESCCESDPVIEFGSITAGGRPLADEQVAALRETARGAWPPWRERG